MNILKSRRGISLAAVLGITTFIIASVTTVFVVGYRQAHYVNAAIQNTEEYANAVSAVETTIAIIARDANLDSVYLADLAAYMGVTITSVGTDVYSVAGTVDANATVTGYIAYIDNLVTPYDSFLQYTGSEPGFVLDPTVTATTMLSAFVTEFVDTEYGRTAPAFTTYASIMTYLDTLTYTTLAFTRRTPANITGMANPTITVDTYCTGSIAMPATKSLTVTNANMFINGNLTLESGRNLTVTGGILIVDGNLTVKNSAIITGTVIVTGSVLFNSSSNSTTERLRGTIYAGGNFTTDRKIVFGDVVYGPSFVFAVGNVNLDSNNQNTATGIVYALSTNYYGNNNGVILSGGVYPSGVKQLSTSGIAADTVLTSSTVLYDEGVATNLLPTGGISFSFRYTHPGIG